MYHAIERRAVQHAFAEYVSAYNAADPKIALKIKHSYRVAGLCDRIGQSVGADDPDLLWLCGMLHDIGRFEQVKRYNTFVDAASIEHAAFGADLLFKEGLLERFAAELAEDDRHILEYAIRNHSAYRIQERLSDREAMYCHILRDADKLDIFRVDCETAPEDIFNVTTEALKSAEVSPAVRDCFQNHTAVQRGLKRTPVDYIVAHICLVFELVYPISRQIAREEGFVDQRLSFESDNPNTQAWFAYMRENVWKA